MEMLILLFLLVSIDKDPAFKDTLRNLLGFYRENREFIAAILQQNAPAPAQNPQDGEPQQPDAQKKSQPEKKVGSMDLLEEYLKRCAV